MPNIYAVVLVAFLITSFSANATTITWVGPDGGYWNNSTNWDINQVPNITDDVFISGFGGTIIVSSIYNVQSLSIVNGSVVVFAGDGNNKRITISCAGCNSGVEAGSYCTFTGVNNNQDCSLSFQGSPVFTVDGNLTFIGGSNSNLIASNASVTVNGSLQFSGSGNARLQCQDGITVVNGEIVFTGGNSIIGETPLNLIFNANSIFQIDKNGGTVPNASWDPSSTLKITGVTTTGPTFTDNAVLGNLMWECPNQTGQADIDKNLTFNRVDIFDTGSGQIGLATSNAAKTFRTWTILGDYTQSGGVVDLSSGTNSTGTIIFKGGNFYAAKTLTESGNGKGVLEFNGTQPQIAYFGSLQNTVDIVINTADKVLLNTLLTINPGATFTLNSGKLVTSAQNLLTISAGALVAGGSTNAYVSGPMRKAGNTAFTFPVGKENTYAPLAITAPAGVTDTFTAEYFHDPYVNTTALMSPLIRVSHLEYWKLIRSWGSGKVQVALRWLNGASSGIDDLNSLAVARFDSTHWVTTGGVASGTLTAGSVLSDSISAFSWFTFGATDINFNPLPVELTLFSAAPLQREVVLRWTTATEKNNAWFVVERSADGAQFAEIGRMAGAGNSISVRNYQFVDKRPLAGRNYYRLRQSDTDGRTSFSPVRMALMGSETRISLFPSPATAELHVRLAEPLQASARWQVFNAAGQVALAGDADAGVQAWQIPVEQLAEGLWFLVVESERERQVQRFVKKRE